MTMIIAKFAGLICNGTAMEFSVGAGNARRMYPPGGMIERSEPITRCPTLGARGLRSEALRVPGSSSIAWKAGNRRLAP